MKTKLTFIGEVLTDLELVWGVVEEGVEGVPLLLEAEVVVGGRELLGDDAVLQDAVPLRHDHHVDGDVLREADGGAEVADEGDLG